MKLQQLRAFLLALETGSFSEAALELGTSQPSVSNAVAALEKELGVRLLERGRFGAIPTEAGLRIAAHARMMLRYEAAIGQEAALARGELRGAVRVATYPSAAGTIIPEVFARLGRRHPRLEPRLEVLNGNEALERALREGRVDVALQLDGYSDDLLGWEVLRDPYRVILAPARIEHRGGAVGAADLERWPLILHKDDQCELLLDDYLASLGIEVEPVQRLNESAVLKNFVARGLGVGFLPALALDELPAGVVALELDRPLERRFFATIVPGSLKLPAVRAFLMTLRDAYPESALPPLQVMPAAPSATP